MGNQLAEDAYAYPCIFSNMLGHSATRETRTRAVCDTQVLATDFDILCATVPQIQAMSVKHRPILAHADMYRVQEQTLQLQEDDFHHCVAQLARLLIGSHEVHLFLRKRGKW